MHINYEAAELVLPGWWCWWLLLHVIPYRLVLMLAPTFAPCVLTFAPYILTFGPCACGVSLLSTGASIPLAQVVVVAQLQLALVVLFHLTTSANRPLAHVVVSPSATCTGGAFSSSHWRKYCICAQATCTVWWWSVVVNFIQFPSVSKVD